MKNKQNMKKIKLMGLFMATMTTMIVFAPLGMSGCPCESRGTASIVDKSLKSPLIFLQFQPWSKQVIFNAGDLNDDGLLDLVVSRKEGNVVDIYFGLDENTFTGPTSYPTNQPLGTAIFYADVGYTLDFAVANSGSHRVTIFLNDGTGVFSISQEIQLTYSPSGVISHLGEGGQNLIVYDRFGIPRTEINNYDGTFTSVPFSEGATPRYAISCGPEPSCNPNPETGIQSCMAAAHCRLIKCYWAACVLYAHGETSWLEYALSYTACAAVFDVEILFCLPEPLIPKVYHSATQYAPPQLGALPSTDI
ncbi:MAG: hypothetical protein NT038_07555 [Euryarchaeota archaeon]|nr:hypothetical protein [Euryarchaeota archaeon]